jgi:hypothetical protein
MTANSPAPPTRRLRWASMESLGFFDAPTSATDAYRPPIDPVPTVTASRPIGRHTNLVQDLWDTTELQSLGLLDWEPSSADRQRLRGRDYRWSRVLIAMFLVAAIGVGAAWLARRPVENAAAASAATAEQATALGEALDGIAPVIQQITADDPVPGEASSALLAVDEAARGLFDASAGLPGSEAGTRSAAAESASLALDATRRLGDAIAFRGALEAMLVAPDLEVDPGLIDLAGATLAFTEWRSKLEATMGDLPESVPANVGSALDTFDNSLDGYQTRYLDGIRAQGRDTAMAALIDLENALAAVRGALRSSLESEVGDVGLEIEDVRGLIERLVG